MGIISAILIISAWSGHLFYTLYFYEVNFQSPVFYLHLLIQAYLFTGLFITSHDAMHRTVSKYIYINNFIGRLTAFLFAGFSYGRLLKNHKLHHQFPGTAQDPDYCVKSQNFFVWFGHFIYKYVTIIQIIVVAITFNILKFWYSEISIWFFYVIPALLGTLQLFYFGTYRPHKQPHTNRMKPHNSRTLKRNHFVAMLTCYFFGYHSEHHTMPHIPWWKLYKTKT
jgi:beta-carotene/zeaxanthin 4-ketolase